eukprot:sb/3465717/
MSGTMRNSVLLATLVALVAITQTSGYRCDRTGSCSATDQCCNAYTPWSKCCQNSAKCCYHHHWTACCGPLDECCWGVHYRGIACCPPGFTCCGVGRRQRRAGCCWITPLWIWILLGLCVGVIVVLLLISIYQCAMEEYAEYQHQRESGSLPNDNPWYYYDYGSTINRDRGPGSATTRNPPTYEPPPTYTDTRSRPGTANSRASTRNGGRPKPPTPQNNGGTNRTAAAVSRTGSVYFSSHDAESEYGSVQSEPFSAPAPGSTINRDRGPGSASTRNPPTYEPPPTYTDTRSRPGTANSRASTRNGGRPKPPTPQNNGGTNREPTGDLQTDHQSLPEGETHDTSATELEERIIDSETVTNHAKHRAEQNSIRVQSSFN